MKEFIQKINDAKLHRQSRIVRWQTRTYVHAENDSEHQLYTTQIVLMLIDRLSVQDDVALKAIKYACCHDYAESTEQSLGDVNHMLKKSNPALAAIVKEQERKAMQEVEEFYNAMIVCEQDKTAKRLVSLADALEALMYVQREIDCNKQTEEWEKIEKELMVRITEHWDKLQRRNVTHV